jgi:cobalt-zinc-cadmium efflux system membrane fusion protein
MRQEDKRRLVNVLTGVAVLIGAVGVAWATRDRWLNPSPTAPIEVDEHDDHSESTAEVLKISPQARRNLNLVTRPLERIEYWKKLQIPGVIVDRPGISDRGVTSPAVGVVTEIHAFEGDTISAGTPLFTLRLFSEYLQSTQSELFKATRETELIREERTRLESIAQSGAVPARRLIELDQQIRRQEGLIQAYRQDLLTRGLTPSQIDQISSGQFIATIVVTAPPVTVQSEGTALSPSVPPQGGPMSDGLMYEVQELKVELGQQVQAGQLLSILSNHRYLYIEGHAFKQDATDLEMAAKEHWPIEVEFVEDDAARWGDAEQVFQIRHLSNTIDGSSRTFDFFIPLTNQSHEYQADGERFLAGRFRPGQRVRLQVPIEKLDNVIVLPATAVVQEGPEAFIFRQNGDLFNRLPVHILYEDRQHVVIENEDHLGMGTYIAQNSAASLNRILKAQMAQGVQADVHVHADGTVHGAH